MAHNSHSTCDGDGYIGNGRKSSENSQYDDGSDTGRDDGATCNETIICDNDICSTASSGKQDTSPERCQQASENTPPQTLYDTCSAGTTPVDTPHQTLYDTCSAGTTPVDTPPQTLYDTCSAGMTPVDTPPQTLYDTSPAGTTPVDTPPQTLYDTCSAGTTPVDTPPQTLYDTCSAGTTPGDTPPQTLYGTCPAGMTPVDTPPQTLDDMSPADGTTPVDTQSHTLYDTCPAGMTSDETPPQTLYDTSPAGTTPVDTPPQTLYDTCPAGMTSDETPPQTLYDTCSAGTTPGDTPPQTLYDTCPAGMTPGDRYGRVTEGGIFPNLENHSSDEDEDEDQILRSLLENVIWQVCEEEGTEEKQGKWELLVLLESTDIEATQITLMESLCMQILINPDDISSRCNFQEQLLPVLTGLLQKEHSSLSLLEVVLRAVTYVSEYCEVFMQAVCRDPSSIQRIIDLVSLIDYSDPEQERIGEQAISFLNMFVSEWVSPMPDMSKLLKLLIDVLLREDFARHVHQTVIEKTISLMVRISKSVNDLPEDLYSMADHPKQIFSNAAYSVIDHNFSYRYCKTESHVNAICRMMPIIMSKKGIESATINHIVDLCRSSEQVCRVLIHSEQLVEAFTSKSSNPYEQDHILILAYVVGGLLKELEDQELSRTLLPIILDRICSSDLMSLIEVLKRLLGDCRDWTVLEQYSILPKLTRYFDCALASQNGSTRSKAGVVNLMQSLIQIDEFKALNYMMDNGFDYWLEMTTRWLNMRSERFLSTIYIYEPDIQLRDLGPIRLIGRPCHLSTWCLVQTDETLYAWSSYFALELWRESVGWFLLYTEKNIVLGRSAGLLNKVENDNAVAHNTIRLWRVSELVSQIVKANWLMDDWTDRTITAGNWQVVCGENKDDIVIKHPEGGLVIVANKRNPSTLKITFGGGRVEEMTGSYSISRYAIHQFLGSGHQYRHRNERRRQMLLADIRSLHSKHPQLRTRHYSIDGKDGNGNVPMTDIESVWASLEAGEVLKERDIYRTTTSLQTMLHERGVKPMRSFLSEVFMAGVHGEEYAQKITNALIPYIDRRTYFRLLTTEKEVENTTVSVILLAKPEDLTIAESRFHRHNGLDFSDMAYALRISTILPVALIEQRLLRYWKGMWSRRPKSELLFDQNIRSAGNLDLTGNVGIIEYMLTNACSQKDKMDIEFFEYVLTSNYGDVQYSCDESMITVHGCEHRYTSSSHVFSCTIVVDLGYFVRPRRYRWSLRKNECRSVTKWVLRGRTPIGVDMDLHEHELDDSDGTEPAVFNIDQADLTEDSKFSMFSVTLFMKPFDCHESYRCQVNNMDLDIYGTVSCISEERPCFESDKSDQKLRTSSTSLYIGEKVIRSRDWKWDDQDGNGPGMVVSIDERGWVSVQWDKNGQTNSYRMNAESIDLELYNRDSRRKRRRHSFCLASESTQQPIRWMGQINQRDLRRTCSLDDNILVDWESCKARTEGDEKKQIDDSDRSNREREEYNDEYNEEGYGYDVTETEHRSHEAVNTDQNDQASDDANEKVKPIKLKYYKSLDELFDFDVGNDNLASPSEREGGSISEVIRLLYQNIREPPHDGAIDMYSGSLVKEYDTNNVATMISHTTNVDWMAQMADAPKNTKCRDRLTLTLHLVSQEGFFHHQIKMTDNSRTLMSYLVELFLQSKDCTTVYEGNIDIIFNTVYYFTCEFETCKCDDTSQSIYVGHTENDQDNCSMTSQAITLMGLLGDLSGDLESGYDSLLCSRFQLQMKESLLVVCSSLPDWCYLACSQARNLLPYSLRLNYFRSNAFGFERYLIIHRRKMSQSSQENYNGLRLMQEVYAIRRNNLFEDANACIQLASDHKAFLEFRFREEEGTGIGPTLEAFDIVARQFQHEQLGMWLSSSWNTDAGSGAVDDEAMVNAENGLFPAPYPVGNCEKLLEVCSLFEKLGRFLARVLLDCHHCDIKLSRHFVRLVQICGRALDESNMKDVDKAVSELFNLLRQSNDAMAVRDLGLYLEYTPSSKVFEYESYNLTESAEPEMLTGENKSEYIKLMTEYMFDTGIMEQVKAFRRGFDQCFPVKWLSCLNPEEIVKLIHGDIGLRWTREELVANILPKSGYRQDSIQMQILVDLLLEYDIDNRHRFVKFVTGANCLPCGGLARLKPLLSISCRYDVGYPSVNTCMHNLKLPLFDTIDQLRVMMDVSLCHTEGFQFN